MENIKKYWNDNLSDKAKIIIISFFTFFTFICASMSNSIVSAYDVKLDNKTYSYKYYLKATNQHGWTFTYYFNDIPNKYQVSDLYDNGYFHLLKDKELIKGHVHEYFSKDDIRVETFGSLNISRTSTNISTNCQAVAQQLELAYKDYDNGNTTVKYAPELLTPEKMKKLTGTISTTTTILIPVGLVIFGLILGIYLIKRLVALFL